MASPAGPSSRASVVRWLVRGASVLVSVAVIDYLVLPQLAGTRKALHVLGGVRPWWANLAIALEAAHGGGPSRADRGRHVAVLPDGHRSAKIHTAGPP